MDKEKIRLARGASYLLPDPGGEVVRDLLDEIDRLRAENEALRVALEETLNAMNGEE